MVMFIPEAAEAIASLGAETAATGAETAATTGAETAATTGAEETAADTSGTASESAGTSGSSSRIGNFFKGYGEAKAAETVSKGLHGGSSGGGGDANYTPWA